MNRADPKDPVNRPMVHLSAGQAMSVARRVVTDRMPYFAGGILSLVPRERVGHGSMSVSSQNILTYDPEVLRSWTPAEGGTVVLHEYLHRFLNHADRLKKLVSLGILTLSADDQELWNRAADCEINDNLEDAKLPFPKGPNGEVHLTPKNCGLPDHRTAEEYVVLLKQEREQKRKSGGQGPDPQGPPDGDGNQGGQGQPQAAAGRGACGSGAGRPVEGEPPTGDPEGRSDVDQQQQRRADAEAIRNYGSKGIGSLPAGLRRYAAEMLTPPKVPWGQKLARATRQAIAYRPGAVDYTRSRPSRRQSAMALLGPDQPVLPSFRAPIVSIAVVADTSGSMGDEQMAKILTEVEGIFRAQAGAQVTFCACDAAVHSLVRVRSVAAIRPHVKGGGGTDFRPAFAALDRSKPRPEIVVFATDLYGPAPAQAPKGMRVIWLVTGNPTGQGPWGETIHIDDN